MAVPAFAVDDAGDVAPTVDPPGSDTFPDRVEVLGEDTDDETDAFDGETEVLVVVVEVVTAPVLSALTVVDEIENAGDEILLVMSSTF